MRQFVPHVAGKYLKLSLFLFIVKEEKEYEKRQDRERTIKMNKPIILNLPPWEHEDNSPFKCRLATPYGSWFIYCRYNDDKRAWCGILLKSKMRCNIPTSTIFHRPNVINVNTNSFPVFPRIVHCMVKAAQHNYRGTYKRVFHSCLYIMSTRKLWRFRLLQQDPLVSDISSLRNVILD